MTKSERKMMEIYERNGWNVIHRGLPDFLLWKKNKENKSYQFCWKEIKSNGQLLSIFQKEVFEAFKKLNFPVEIIKTSEYRKITKKEKINIKKETMKKLRLSGLTYSELGKLFDLSRQRIFQIITTPHSKYNKKPIINKIIGNERIPELVNIRHLIIFFLRNRLKLSYPLIAKIMKRDHSSIMHANQKIKNNFAPVHNSV